MNRSTLNGVKTAVLLGALWAILLGIGGLLAAGTGNYIFIVIFAFIGVAGTAYSYWNSDKLAIRAMNALPVSEAEFPGPETVRELAEKADKPMPRLYIAPTPSPQRFRDGQEPEERRVCVSRMGSSTSSTSVS